MTFFKQNDTWPPLRGRATDDDGLMPLEEADSLKVLIKSGGTLIEGTATAIAGGDPDGMNFFYTWDSDDLDLAGSYQVELEITWDASATPPKVETVPSDSYTSLTVVADLG